MPTVFLMDRLTKCAVRRGAVARALIPGVVRCRLVRNTGAAFSLLSGQQALLCALTALLLGGLTAWLIARPDDPPLQRAGFWMIVGGGLGNLFDRLAYGSVIDFLELEFVRFAVFNVADIFVCAGAALAALGLMLAERRGKERDHGEL